MRRAAASASLAAGLLAAATLLAPVAAAETVAEDAEGKWFWSTQGSVRATSNVGQPVTADIFIGDDGAYFFRIHLDPAGRNFVQCVNGAGFLFLGGPSWPLTHCSIEGQGNLIIPRATIVHLGAAGVGVSLTGVGVFQLAH